MEPNSKIIEIRKLTKDKAEDCKELEAYTAMFGTHKYSVFWM